MAHPIPLPTLAVLKHAAALILEVHVVRIQELVVTPGELQMPLDRRIRVIGHHEQAGSPNNGSHAEEALIYHHQHLLAPPLLLEAQNSPCADGGDIRQAHTNHWHDCERLLLAVASHWNSNVQFFADHCYPGSRMYLEWNGLMRQILTLGREHGIPVVGGGVHHFDADSFVHPHLTFCPNNTIELRAWM